LEGVAVGRIETLVRSLQSRFHARYTGNCILGWLSSKARSWVLSFKEFERIADRPRYVDHIDPALTALIFR
jgi:hypothetical protein